ncbi:MAG: hypothetical protein HKN12_11935, partial [Gemmatimonadetes bacterium]|nr:hypothetical protein [Gemmatimonadota bacterium]
MLTDPRFLFRLVPVLLLLAVGCSDSSNPAGPEDEPDPTEAPVIEFFSVSATDAVVLHGDFATLRWRAVGATSATVSPPVDLGGSAANGSATIRPAFTTTYTLTASNQFGTVTETLDVNVLYRPGVYVDPVNGDDANLGDTPLASVATLPEALSRTLGGGTIFLAGGLYTSPILIDAAQVSVYGGLDPETFFEGFPREQFLTTIRPTSGVPLTIRNTSGTMEISNIQFDARDTEAFGAHILDAEARLLNCSFDTRASMIAPAGTPTALLIESVGAVSGVEARSCKFYGSRSLTPFTTRGVSIEQNGGGANAVLLSNCFIDGGRALQRSSGVNINSTGEIGIGMCTIGAEITSPGAGSTGSA